MEEVFVKNNQALWEWLVKNHTQTKSVGLVHYKYASGKSDISRDSLVDYLLCFGWIDSVLGKVDEYRTKIRISPRKPKSAWSQINKDKILRLTKENMMQEAGLAMVQIAKEMGTWDKAYLPSSQMTTPDDFIQRLQQKDNKEAYQFFKSFNKANLYAVNYRLALITDPDKREQAMSKLIQQFKNKKLFYPQRNAE